MCEFDLCNICGEDLTLLATSIATELSSGKDTDEILVLRNIYSQIATSLGTIAAHQAYCEKRKKDKHKKE